MEKTKETKKKRPAFKLMVIVLIVAILFVYIISLLLKTPDNSSSNIQDQSNIPELEILYNEDQSVSLNLESDTEIRAESNLNEYRLIISSEDLLDDDALVSLTPINSITNLPDDLGFVGGVELSPSGTYLLNPIELTINISPENDVDELIAFAYNQEGEYYFFPYHEIDDLIVLNLTHFSGYGLLTGDPSDLGSFDPETVPEDSLNELGKINAEARGREDFNGSLNEEEKERVKEILERWYKTSILPSLQLSQTDIDKIIPSYNEFIDWLKRVQIFGLDDSFAEEITQGRALLVSAINKANDELYIKCKEEIDPSAMGEMIRLLKVANIVEQDNSEVDTDKVIENLRKCGVFKLELTSVIETEEVNGISISSEIGETTLRFTEDLTKFEGNGTHSLDEFILDSEANTICESRSSTALPLRVHESKMSFGTSDFEGEIIVSINPDDEFAPDITFNCSEGSDNSISLTIGHPWIVDFDILHEDEIINTKLLSEEAEKYKIIGWEFIGREELYARKEYSRQSDGMGEVTVFELIHTPE